MIEVAINKVKKNYGFKNVLDDFSLEVKTGERVGLIGSNGCGKTTIFKIITGEENCNSGEVSIRKNANVGYFNQMPIIVTDDVTIKDVLSSGIKEVYDLEKKLRELEEQMGTISDGDQLDKTMQKYSATMSKYEEIGGYQAEANIAKICEGFNIDRSRLDQNFNSLSGGEKTIVTLASLMISNPTILLLDEPTNHLDISTLEWFEKYLINYNGTVIVVSHDQYFLDKVVNKIVLIEKGNAEIFHGNYSDYINENEKRISLEFEAYKDQQKMIAEMKKSIKKLYEFGRLASPGGEIFFKRAASIQKRLDRIEVMDKPQLNASIPLVFDINKRSGKDVLTINGLDICLDNRLLIEDIELTLHYGEKVCLIGENGSGKSTFIKTILSYVEKDDERVKIGSSVRIGYIPQELAFTDEKMTVLDYARENYDDTETHLRAALNRFLFCEDSVFKRVGSLSGGEKVRLKLFNLIQQKANFIILDEPTNHIDINTKEVLEDALENYSGSVLFISHDRFFINKLAKRIFSIEKNKIVVYDGDYDYFKAHRS